MFSAMLVGRKLDWVQRHNVPRVPAGHPEESPSHHALWRAVLSNTCLLSLRNRSSLPLCTREHHVKRLHCPGPLRPPPAWPSGPPCWSEADLEFRRTSHSPLSASVAMGSQDFTTAPQGCSWKHIQERMLVMTANMSHHLKVMFNEGLHSFTC